jgi:hypothetical protein
MLTASTESAGIMFNYLFTTTKLIINSFGLRKIQYEIKVSPETGHFLQHPTLHTSIVVKDIEDKRTNSDGPIECNSE